MFGRHSEEVRQTLRYKTSCGPLVVTSGFGAVTLIVYVAQRSVLWPINPLEQGLNPVLDFLKLTPFNTCYILNNLNKISSSQTKQPYAVILTSLNQCCSFYRHINHSSRRREKTFWLFDYKVTRQYHFL